MEGVSFSPEGLWSGDTGLVRRLNQARRDAFCFGVDFSMVWIMSLRRDCKVSSVMESSRVLLFHAKHAKQSLYLLT